MVDPPRIAHLVGSIPADTAEEAMTRAVSLLGPHLRRLPDGEPAERHNWIVSIIDALRDHPDLRLVREGDWSDYEHTPRLTVRRGHRFTPDGLDFGHVAAFDAARPVWQRLRDDHGSLSFQAGVPSDLDVALFTFAPPEALRRRRVFAAEAAREMQQIHDRAGADVVFQLEVPAELVFVARTPAPLRPAIARWLAGGIARLARSAPEGSRFGLHLCLGDLGHEALGRMRDTAPLVALANAVLRAWPAGRRLEYLHAPLTSGTDPAPADERFYRPLAALRLPAGTRFVAGMVNEAAGLDHHRTVQHMVENRIGQTADLAAPCGLGRRTPEAADANMRLTAELLDRAG